MPEQVRVEDLEVFNLFRAALLKFKQAADQSMANADSEISKTRTWLENEQGTYWQSQLRKREEAVSKARDAVRQKKLYKDFSGNTRMAIEEEKVLAKCMAAVTEAQQKIEAVRKWLPRLEKANDMYRGGVSRLSRTIMDDVPRGVALLDRLALTLEQYLQIETPMGTATESTEATPFDGAMSRGSDVLPAAPVAAEPKPTEAAPEAAKPTEDGHVAAG